jgi:hypothetical protein
MNDGDAAKRDDDGPPRPAGMAVAIHVGMVRTSAAKAIKSAPGVAGPDGKVHDRALPIEQFM